MGRSRKSTKRKYSSARKRAEEHKGGFERTAHLIPDGVSLFSLDREGIRKIDVLPYEAKGSNPNAEDGELHYERTYWVHGQIGANSDRYVCPARTANQRCPICDHRRDLMKDPDAEEQLIKDLAPKERQLFNVIDREEPDKGVQLWEISYHLFGKLLDKEIRNSDEDDEYDNFFHLEDGKTLRLGIAERSFGGRTFYEVETIGFKNRSEPYEDEVLEKVHCLDDLPIVLEYDRLKAIFLQTADEDEEDEEDSAGRSEKKERKPVVDDDDDEPEEKPVKRKPKKREVARGDDVWYKGGQCEVLKVSGDGTSLTLEDETGEIIRAVGVEDLDDGPPKSSKKSKETKKKDEDDDWDGWDDADDEAPVEGEPAETESESKSKSKKEEKDDDWDDWD